MSLFGEEPVTLLVATSGAPGALGTRPKTYQPGVTHSGLVSAVSAELAQRYGLTDVRERYRVRLPPGTVLVPGDRLRFRNRDWEAVQVSVRASHTRVIVQGV